MSFEGKALNPGEGEQYSVLGDAYTFKASNADTGGAYTLTEITTIGDGAPPHIHRTEEEAFYVLEGEVKVRVGENVVTGTPGSFVLIPRGVMHTFSKVGDAPAKLLVIISPPGFEQFFKEIHGVTDMDAVMDAAQRHNLEIIGPPPG
ncbi:MAG: cupin domain-containing protein [SAR202 cluster bacterium]|nr:cupin domain-containing protein [SAR202 cluster bacterium]